MRHPRATQQVVVLVGTDHHPFTRLLDWSLELAAEGWATWVIQHGTTAWPTVVTPPAQGVDLLTVADLQRLLATADCVVTHAGPGLLMEARAAGHDPVVVPRDPAHGEHVDDHQLRFAAHLARTGHLRTATSCSGVRDQVRAVLAGGHALVPRPRSGLADATTLTRFADHVEATVQHRRMHWWSR